MAQITADRVKETSTTTGTGSYSLAGAVSGFRAFSSVCANTDTVYYAAVGGTDWEVGLGTWATGNTLARTTILASSNAGAAVDWIAGTREVFLTHPARAATVNVQEFGGPSTSGTSTWTKPAGAKLVHIVIHGAGGGGGAGRRRNTSEAVASSGGAGGGAGGRTETWINASTLNSTETVVVGAGGSGGVSNTTDNTNGSNGSNGNLSYVGDPTVVAMGRFGIFGQGGLNSTADGGFNGSGFSENQGGAAQLVPTGGNGRTTTPLSGNKGGYRGGGGGGGGSHAAGGATLVAGADGGLGGAFLTAGPATNSGMSGTISGGGGLGGTTDGASGSAGNDSGNPFFGGSGGGGGANSTSSTAGSGGNGGWPGGGGGGGGASVAGQNSGAGGNGANGFVRITTYF